MIDNKLPGHLFGSFYFPNNIKICGNEYTKIWREDAVYMYPGKVMVHVTDPSYAEFKVRDAKMHFMPLPFLLYLIFFVVMDTNSHFIFVIHHGSTYVTFYKWTESLKLSPKQKSPAVWFDNYLSSSLSRCSFLFMTVTLHHTNLQYTTSITAPHSDITEV